MHNYLITYKYFCSKTQRGLINLNIVLVALFYEQKVKVNTILGTKCGVNVKWPKIVSYKISVCVYTVPIGNHVSYVYNT